MLKFSYINNKFLLKYQKVILVRKKRPTTVN